MFFHVFRLIVQEAIQLLAWFFDVLFIYFDWRSKGPKMARWLHFLMSFHVTWLMVPWYIDVLASFFDVLSCNSIDRPMGHSIIGLIFWCSFKHFDSWSKSSLACWLHSSMSFHVTWLMVQWYIDVLASFFDVLSCNSIDRPMGHSIIGLIFWCSFMHFDWWSKSSLACWLHSLMFFHVSWLMVQWYIDVLASFFDVLWCISIDRPMDHWRIDFILWCSFKYS